jgi:autotransporter-associated beta strand protein
LALGAPGLSAQTSYYWAGDGTDNNWGTAGNFKDAASGGANSAPASNRATQLVFGARPANRTTANNTVSNFQLNAITFESATDGAGTTFTISGSQLRFRDTGGNNPFITQNSARAHTISAPLRIDRLLTLDGDGSGLVTLSGTWTGTAGITKSGTSNFLVTGDASAAGTATINGGTLALGGSGALGLIQFRGGVLATSGTFARTLGTGTTNVNFGTGGGGFAAYGGALTVSTNLGTWGTTTNSLPTGAPLRLGSTIADNVVTLTSNLDLGGAVRTVTLADNTNSSADRARIEGVLSNGGLSVDGTGRLELAGANTYAGTTSIGSGVTVNLRNAAALGTTASGTTVASGGALELEGGFTVGAEALQIAGTGVSGGGALRNVSGTNTYGGAVTLGAASRIDSASGELILTSGSAVSGAGQNLTVGGSGNVTLSSGIATGSGGLAKDGDGTLALGGTSSYTGATSVTGGTLLVNGSTAAGSAVTVGDGSGTDTLGGTGTIGGATTIQSGGRITGGTAGTVGDLTVANDLALGTGSTWLVDLAGASADRILGIANLGLGGATLAVQTSSPTWQLGDTWTIAQFSGARTGTFAGLDDGATFFAGGAGGQFRINYHDDVGFVTITAVPEPPTLVALVLLLCGALFGPRSYRAWRVRHPSGKASALTGPEISRSMEARS